MEESKVNKYPGDVDEVHPEVFNLSAMPEQPLEKKPGQLPEHMIRQFFEQVGLYSKLLKILTF